MLLVILSLIASSCLPKKEAYIPQDESKERETFEKNDSIEAYKKNSISTGIARVLAFYKGASFSILNLDSSNYASLFKDSIKLKDRTYSFYNDDVSEVLPCHALYPDYSIWFVIAENTNSDFYKIFIGNEFKLIPKSNCVLDSFEDHMKKYCVGLNENSPLRENMSEAAAIVENYSGEEEVEFDYKVLEVKGDWMKVKLCEIDLPLEPSFKELGLEKEGWVKWKKGNKILITIYYDYA